MWQLNWYITIIPILGKIREILTSDDKTIQMNKLTTVYLDYIKMIEVKEQASKDAPTEVVKNNVTKIYNEVTSGGMFSSLTNGIRGIFSSTRAASSSQGAQTLNAGQVSTSAPMPPSLPSSAQSIPGRIITMKEQSVPETFREAKALLSKIKRCCEEMLKNRNLTFGRQLINQIVRLQSGIGLRFKLKIERDPEARKDKDWLRDNIDAIIKMGQ